METKRDKLLLEVVKVFLKLGLIGFGGPAAHIAMMERELVTKRKWLSHEYFLDLIGATNLIPGPNSTEMAMHCGYVRAGWRGLFLAGCSFIVPAVLITSFFAWLYQEYGTVPSLQPFIYGIKAAVLAVILSALIPLAKKALKSAALGVIGLLTLILCLYGLNEVLLLFLAGFAGSALTIGRAKANSLAFIPLLFLMAGHQNKLLQSGYAGIFFSFLKVGALLYGSGYVLFGFLDAELVSRELISKQVLFDAISVGQFTPGPVLSSAAFIGWQMKGAGGAIAASVGVFLPSFFFVLLLNPFIRKLRSSAVMIAFIDTVNIASIAIIFVVLKDMAFLSLTDWRSALIAILSLLLSFGVKQLNTTLVIAGGAVLGYLLYLI